MTRSVPAGAVAAIFVSACAMMDPQRVEPEPPSYAQITAEADLFDSRGVRVAQAAASQAADGVRIRLDTKGMAPGVYGAHIHAIGRCDPPDFASAGPHWNPSGQQHGKNNPQGTHLGDLPNMMVGADGRGTLEIMIAGASLAGKGAALLDEDGAAIVMHERPDDYRTDPSGNSGARIVCGIFR